MTKIPDPWRVTTPLNPEPVTKPAKTDTPVKRNIGDVDPGFDAKTPYYDLRGNNGSVRIQAKSGDVAIQKLINVFHFVRHELGDEILKEDGIGYETEDESFNVHLLGDGTSCITHGKGSDKVAIYFFNQSHDEGLSRVVKLLITLNRTHPNIYKKYGVEPIQR